MPETDAEREAEREKLEAQDTADSLASGYAEWEVQIALPNHGDAVELAERLESEGMPVTRRWKHLIVGADDEDDANALAARLRERGPGGVRAHRRTGRRDGLGRRAEALPLVLLRPEHVAREPPRRAPGRVAKPLAERAARR